MPAPMVPVDQTRRFLDSILLPDTVPSASQLQALFAGQLKMTDGTPLRLPVTPALYFQLVLRDGRLAELLQPDTETHGSSAILLDLVLDPPLGLV